MLDKIADGIEDTGQATRPASLSAPLRYYMVVVLMLMSATSILDRQIIALLIEPIRKDLGLSDTAMGFLTGSAFSIAYILACIPVARLADRWSRGRMVAIALVIWSLMTMLCGAAGNAIQLFFARIGVGGGEAGATAPAQALISDMFPRNRRGTAMAILMLCVPVGMGLGVVAAGWVLAHYGWRMTFVAAGIPGLVLGVLILLTFPPVQPGMADGVTATGAPDPFLKTVRLLWSIRSLPCLMLAGMLLTSVSMGLVTWLPPFLARSHHLGPAAIGAGLGAAFGIGSLIGSLSGGPVVDWLGRRDLRWHFWVPTLTVPLSGVLACAALLSPISCVWPILAVQTLLSSFFAGPTLAIGMNLAPVTARATTAAIMAVFVNSMGIAIGPQIVGVLSDLLRPEFGEGSLRVALICITALAVPGGWLFWLGSRTYRADLATVDRLNRKS